MTATMPLETFATNDRAEFIAAYTQARQRLVRMIETHFPTGSSFQVVSQINPAFQDHENLGFLLHGGFFARRAWVQKECARPNDPGRRYIVRSQYIGGYYPEDAA